MVVITAPVWGPMGENNPNQRRCHGNIARHELRVFPGRLAASIVEQNDPHLGKELQE
jgi:hypothetical protein